MTARGFLGRFLRTLLLLNHFFVQVVRVLRRAFFVRTIARQTETLRVSFIMQDVASEETMEELKARVLSSSTYDKHMVPMQLEQTSLERGLCLIDIFTNAVIAYECQ